ncbi:indolepyruvate ferredoxin oxidoreductase subunit alpha [candidate division LCP-89 bacterium B3_LCP]|uniref:Indolepyruvate oxidoreductase subunit IorA n=1 Tax=candidate division LCP-89 bacterium B3_LCP TaxID=2012998 RepID=A0A532V5Q8_UNCL8|nr:MAG: indolepyruvate ferredoxin oxidoreductase subunit alpha [candidate division LCP-89 bacterium B3_LCP]
MEEVVEKKNRTEILLGNVAIARGLVEAGTQVAASYPGTPSSEILPGVVRFKKEENLPIYTEWSANEKIAFETALAASWCGKRAACSMKMVGLNVAADPLMSAAYTGVKGGFLIIVADDPGPHSSQTEQDTRMFAHFAKVPCLDPADPEEARQMVNIGYELSEEFRVPVILRPAIRVCHAKQPIEFLEIKQLDRPAEFEKETSRWAATPKFRLALHHELNEKLTKIKDKFESLTELNPIYFEDSKSELGIIASGVPFANALDILKSWGVEMPVLKIGTPYPLPEKRVAEFIKRFRKVLILEETDYTIEMQIRDKSSITGRMDGFVPQAGELVPEVIASMLARFLDYQENEDTALTQVIAQIDKQPRRPTLCPGCPHRASFYAIKRAFPKAIFPSDIGCYTLGTNLDAVDTCVDMGGAITIAHGLAVAYAQNEKKQPVIATIGDSTFYHAGIPPLLNSVYNDARYVLVILDNEITAMTGFQPTPGSGVLADGAQGRQIPLENVVRGCGVEYLKIINPYNVEEMIKETREAVAYTRREDGGVAVLISRFPCVLREPSILKDNPVRVTITDECNGCMLCVDRFECPAILKDDTGEKVVIDRKICVDCGVCMVSCYRNAIVPAK